MMQSSRRTFIRLTTAAAAGCLVGRTHALSVAKGSKAGKFNVLVVGDSLVWGQGLLEEQKFYALTVDWLKRQSFIGSREVDLKVKAHSGATIMLAPEQAAKLVRAPGREDRAYPGEVNVSFPSMWRQVELAANEYRASGHPTGADLVMTTAGITDITVEGVLNPSESPDKLPPLVREVCYERVSKLLDHIHVHNPRALIAVAGYYPIISQHSSTRRVLNGWLDVKNFPAAFQPFINNPIFRRLSFRSTFRNAVARSKVWVEESNRYLEAAIDDFNKRQGEQAAVFIRSPLTEEHAAEAPHTKLFRMNGNGTTNDPLYFSRREQCRTVFKELERTAGMLHSPRRCSIAGVGHPDPAGARLYADAINAELAKVLPKRLVAASK